MHYKYYTCTFSKILWNVIMWNIIWQLWIKSRGNKIDGTVKHVTIEIKYISFEWQNESSLKNATLFGPECTRCLVLCNIFLFCKVLQLND